MSKSLRDLTNELLFKADFLPVQFYLAQVESFLEPFEEYLRNRRIEIDRDRTTMEEESEEDYSLQNPADLMISGFTNFLRKSFFLYLFSFLESNLVQQCRSRAEKQAILLSLSDIAGGSVMDKARTYFTKVLGVYFPSDTPEWREIQNYRRLRNCIVHSRGTLKDDHDPLRVYVVSRNSLNSDEGEIILGKEFCEEACVTVTNFLNQLFHGNATQ
jgi:hypothetical protein